ncbi:MAG: xylulokinase [Naasia sp.]|uniref:FGGY family carbohydrate kinase n=1 Tax=Naasia sp. TaxID=2546198 RepID=UPI002622F75A|nr:FGGY family carbohydrate kinase [Naasia sp.]MCU1570816.1 xylulokinase [Naasia sp.]
MPGERLLLGIDIGTSGCKATLFTQGGQAVGAGYGGYELIRPQESFVEQDPERWWSATVAATREAMRGVQPDRVAAVGLSSANALVLVDRDGAALGPAIMQLDRRAVQEAEDVERSMAGDPEPGRLYARPQAGPHWLPTLLWLSRHEPDRWRRLHGLLFPSGWVCLRMTGVAAVDSSRASTTLLFDREHRDWDDQVADRFHIPTSWLPRLVDGSEITGTLRAGPAGELGLPGGIPVTVGAMDSVAAAFGVGGPVQGELVLILGTTARALTASPEWQTPVGTLSCALPGASDNLVMAVAWGFGTRVRDAASVWTATPDFSHLDDRLRSRAAGLPAGSERDVQALAIVDTAMTDLVEKAELLQHVSPAPWSALTVTGGAARVKGIVAGIEDRFGIPARVRHEADAETRGAAMLAGVATGWFANVPDAVGAMSGNPGGSPVALGA